MDIVSDCQVFRDLFTYRGYLWFSLLVRCSCLWQSRHSIWRYVTWAGGSPWAAYAWLRSSKWKPEALYSRLFTWLAPRWGTRVAGHLLLALDDTHTPKPYARKMRDLGWLFEEAVRVTDPEGKTRWGLWGQLGHCWVTLALLWRQAPGIWQAFPVALGAYVRKKTLAKQGQEAQFQTLYQVAKQLLQRLPEAVLVVADSFYRGHELIAGTAHHLLSRLTKAAVVYEVPVPPARRQRGRPTEYGPAHKLKEWAATLLYTTVEVMAYHKLERIAWATCLVRLKGFGKRDLRLVVIRSLDRPELPPLFLFTTLVELTALEVFECYTARFGIELAFRQLKTDMGLGQYHVRSQASIRHWVALVVVAYALLKVRMIEQQLPSMEAAKRHYYSQELRSQFLPLALLPNLRQKILAALDHLDRLIA